MVSRDAHLAPENPKGATDCLARTGSYKGRTKRSTLTLLPAKLLISNRSR